MSCAMDERRRLSVDVSIDLPSGHTRADSLSLVAAPGMRVVLERELCVVAHGAGAGKMRVKC